MQSQVLLLSTCIVAVCSSTFLNKNADDTGNDLGDDIGSALGDDKRSAEPTHTTSTTESTDWSGEKAGDQELAAKERELADKEAELRDYERIVEQSEKEAENLNIKILQYHTDNGIFKSNGWVDNCFKKYQSMTSSVVNLHHQICLAKTEIRWLQELVRPSFSHAAQKWPGLIKPILWPYTLRASNTELNNAPNMADIQRRTP